MHRVDCHHYFIIDDHHLSCMTHKMTIEFPSFVSRLYLGYAFQWQFTLICGASSMWDLSFWWFSREHVTVKNALNGPIFMSQRHCCHRLWFVCAYSCVNSDNRSNSFFFFFCYSFIINSGARLCVSAFLFFVDKKVLSCSFLSTNSLTFKCKCVDGFPFRNERDHSHDFMSLCLFFSFGYPVCYTVCRRRFKCFFDEHVHSFSSLISCVPNKLIQFEHDELSSTTNKRNNNETNKWQL